MIEAGRENVHVEPERGVFYVRFQERERGSRSGNVESARDRFPHGRPMLRGREADRETIEEELDEWAEDPLSQRPGYMAPIARDAGVNLVTLMRKYTRMKDLDEKGRRRGGDPTGRGALEEDRLHHELAREVERLKEQVEHASRDQLDEYVRAREAWIES